MDRGPLRQAGGGLRQTVSELPDGEGIAVDVRDFAAVAKDVLHRGSDVRTTGDRFGNANAVVGQHHGQETVLVRNANRDVPRSGVHGVVDELSKIRKVTPNLRMLRKVPTG